MGHLAARPLAATATSSLDLAAPVVPVAMAVPSMQPATLALTMRESAKRPHDPPHLHAFSLLI
jgi:hypothetical protein